MPFAPVRRRRRTLVIALAALVALGLAGCAPASPSATVQVLAGDATVDGAAVTSSQRIDAGDVVEVSGTDAVAEIAWGDGSFLRLASGSRFTVGGEDVRGTLEEGSAWNTVGPASVGYAVATPDGTVRASTSSTFAVACDDSCSGTVATGAVAVGDADIPAPASFDFDGGSEPVGWDAVYGDGFALANAARDTQAGYPDPAMAWAAGPPTEASLAGVFTGDSTPTAEECTGWAEECDRVRANIFGPGQPTATFVPECVAPGACTIALQVTTSTSDGGGNARTFPLTFDGTAYSYDATVREDAYCFFDDGRTEGRLANTLSGRLVPTAAEVRDGVFTVTRLEAELTSSVTRLEGTTDPTCAEFEYEWSRTSTAVFDLEAGSSTAPVAYDLTAAPAPRPVTGLARPSVLSELRSPLDAIPTISQLPLLIGGIVIIALVLGYPAYLLSRVVSDRYDRVAGDRAAKVRARLDAHPVRRVVLVVLGVAVAALITAALDPGFGASFASVPADPSTIVAAAQSFVGDVGSWRVVLTAAASFVIFLGLGSLIVRLVGLRVAPGVKMPLEFRWGSLLILLAGVVLSRVFDITPGVIFGLVAGLVIADSIPKQGRGRLALTAALFALATGLIAWVVYGFLAPVAAAAPTDVVLVTSTELLSALTLEAVSTLPIALLPVLGLDGFPLRAWRILLWLPVYALGLALFVLVLFTVPGSWTEIQGDALPWLIGFGAFTVVSVLIYVIHRALERRRERREAAAAATETV